MSNLLTRLYKNIAFNTPYLGKPGLLSKYARNVLLEFPKDFDTKTTDIASWNSLEKKYYLMTSRGTRLAAAKSKEGSDIKGHRGEVSAILALLSFYEPAVYQKLIELDRMSMPGEMHEEFKKIIQRYTSKSDGTAYDVDINGRRYEVKEITYSVNEYGDLTSSGTVQTGTHGKGVASTLIRNIREVEKIAAAYKKIRNPEMYLPGPLIASLQTLITGQKIGRTQKPALDNIERGELGFDLIRFLRNDIAYQIEKFLESKGEVVSEPLSVTAQQVKSIYSDYLAKKIPGAAIKDADARSIDSKAKEIIDKDFKRDPVEAFIEACQSSVYRSVKLFDDSYTDYFNLSDPDTQSEKSKELLRRLFPEIGLFVVSPEGYIYAGKDMLHTIITPYVITAGSVKVKRTIGFSA